MKLLHLIRDETSSERTLGTMAFGGEEVQTIERPWLSDDPGGTPFQSCVPAGRYTLRPHLHHGHDVVALVNAGHSVYYMAADRPHDVGRYMVLIHKGNWVDDVVGCIAPGLARAVSDKGPMVASSSKAMKRIMDYINGDQAELLIEWLDGEPI